MRKRKKKERKKDKQKDEEKDIVRDEEIERVTKRKKILHREINMNKENTNVKIRE